MGEGREGESERRLEIAVRLLSSFMFTNVRHFLPFPASYLGSPLIENDLDVEDFAKLLKRKKREKMKRLNELVSHVLHLATGCQYCSAMMSWH